MSDESFAGEEPFEPSPERLPRDPADTLRIALLVYLVVNLVVGVPLMLVPTGFLDFIGVDEAIAAELGGLRLFGAMLVAWGIAAMLVVARPAGRAYFVTAGALQLSFGAAAILYTWLVGDSFGAVWFRAVTSAVLVASAGYLWWARYRARAVMY
jgi:hypothetical protein